MSAYKEFSGKTVEEALKAARDEFGAELNDLDFEILTPGSRGVLGMGAEPARIVAAPRHALGGAAPKRDAAAAQPLPRPPAREFGDRDRGPRRDDRGDRGPRRDDRDRGPRREDRPAYAGVERDRPPRSDDRGPRRDDRDRGPRRDDRPREGRGARSPQRGGADVSASEAAEVAAARGSLAAERADLEAAEASPEALAAGKRILETVMGHLGFDAVVEVAAGETSRLNVVAQGDDRDALGALIGRKGERLSALQHLVNLMLSKEMGSWTRVLVDVEDYRGRRERQLRELADRAAARVMETGKMLQLEPMPALERRWIHLTLRDHAGVATQSIGEEPNRRVVLVPRGG
ncbi:MAG TPA: RNA-binding cell elongation regulator Jag/EloR [Candidatus Limnocylindrales bacterium]|nr:RNA-binding cell elongation regulator Jag/EloR [Candidatus Limnocylindrales bacterium]